jgi:protein phosphatase
MEDIRDDIFGLTATGKVRQENEDQFLIGGIHKALDVTQTSLAERDRAKLLGGKLGALLVVADGVGGAAAGAQASGLAVDALISYITFTMPCFFHFAEDIGGDVLKEIATAFQTSHEKVLAEAAAESGYEGMATTLTMAYILWPRAFIVQVGDSRLYLQRDGWLDQITRDQTMAEDLVDQGILKPELAEKSRWSNVLSSAVGGRNSTIDPVLYDLGLAQDDILLLCSDGLTKHVSDPEISEILTASATAEDACKSLVQAALDGGGTDNVTVVVARFPGE